MARDRRPLAVQVHNEMAALIRSGQLRPGDQFPTEAELVARYQVARTTIREALKLLEQDGLLHVQHGVGRFVASFVERPITRLESVTTMMESLGYRVTNRVLSVTQIPADEDAARALGLSPGAPVIRLERVRLQGDEPLIYSVDVVPAGLIDGDWSKVDWNGSLAGLLRSGGHPMTSALGEIRAVILPAETARRVGAPPRTPWLLLKATNLDDEGRPIIYSHDYHRGDLFKFNVLRRADPES
jgi:GntR family transcriptional regulator